MSDTTNPQPITEVGSPSPISGTFTFDNQLGGTITSGWAKHWTADYGTEQIDLTGLGANTVSAATPFQTSSSNIDHWAFSAVVDGITYGVNDKHCGFESEDAGGNVTLGADNQYFNFVVFTPVSNGCQCQLDEG